MNTFYFGLNKTRRTRGMYLHLLLLLLFTMLEVGRARFNVVDKSLGQQKIPVRLIAWSSLSSSLKHFLPIFLSPFYLLLFILTMPQTAWWQLLNFKDLSMTTPYLNFFPDFLLLFTHCTYLYIVVYLFDYLFLGTNKM